MTPHLARDPDDWPALLSLLHRAFKGMDGRIDPPSSLHRLTAADLAAPGHEVWVIGQPAAACMVLTPKPGRLYLGKLAVDPHQQGRGHGKSLITQAETRARALGLPLLELETRVELSENHAFFKRQGFTETARKAHDGYNLPTSITFTKPIQFV